MKSMTLAQVAECTGGRVEGDDSLEVSALGTLQSAQPGQLSFLANPRYRQSLESTRATAVLCRPDMVAHNPVASIVVDDPYGAFADISHRFDTAPSPEPGIHPRALVADTAMLADNVSIGANAIIEAGAVLEDGVVVMANSVVGAGSRLGQGVRLWPNVTIYHGVVIGPRTTIHSGAVIGADGFGFAPAGAGWKKIAQVGGVRIGADVDIGAGTTIDRGAIEDTVIGDGVIIDNQVQIAHNVVIGDHTAIAGKAGIAGSARVGRNCVIAGAVGIAGHLDICDGVQIMAMSLVSRSINEPGVYASGQPVDQHANWRKNTVRIRQLDDLFRRVKRLEKCSQDNGDTER